MKWLVLKELRLRNIYIRLLEIYMGGSIEKDRFGVGGPRCSFSRWFRISHLKNSQKWSRGGASPFKIRILGLKLPFFGPPEKGLQIYFTVSVMVLIHRCICIFDWKSTKTPPNLFPGGHMPLQKSIFRVQMTLFSVYQYNLSKTP